MGWTEDGGVLRDDWKLRDSGWWDAGNECREEQARVRVRWKGIEIVKVQGSTRHHCQPKELDCAHFNSASD